MFGAANGAANQMAKQIAMLEKQKQARIAQAKQRQQHLNEQGGSSSLELRQTPASPRTQTAKVSRGSFFGFGAKKKPAAIEDTSSHTGADPTVVTADETQASNNNKPAQPAGTALANTSGHKKNPTRKTTTTASGGKLKRSGSNDPDGDYVETPITDASRRSHRSVDTIGSSGKGKRPSSTRSNRSRDTKSLDGAGAGAADDSSKASQPRAPRQRKKVDSGARKIAETEQLLKEDAGMYYVEEAMSATSKDTSRGAGSRASSASKKKTKKKKLQKRSILKNAEREPEVIGVSGTTGIDPSALQQQTIVVKHDFSDEVTCLTMDDFEKPKRSGTTKAKRAAKQKNAVASTTSGSSGITEASLSEILRKDINSKKEPVLIAALDAIHEYASSGAKQRSKVCAFGGIPSILRILDGKKSTRRVLLAAFATLEAVTTNDPRNQETTCELNAISSISFCMQRQFLVKEVVLAACKSLEVVTSFMRLESDEEEDAHAEINTHGAMTVLSCCLMTHPKEKEITMHTIAAATNICMYRPDELQKFSESGGIVAMTAALEKKWKSKSRKAQAQADLEIIFASVEQSSSDDEEKESSSEASSEEEDSEEEEESEEESD